MRVPVSLHAGILLALSFGATAANAQVPVAEHGASDPGAPVPAPIAAEPVAVAEPARTNQGLYLRTTAELGYGQFEYLTAGRHGGGVVFSTGITVGVGIGEHLMIGGSAIFRPILRANGESSDGDDWGPYFSPGGYFGPTLGVLGERLSFDITLGIAGGGSSGSGGFGLAIAPSLTVTLMTRGRLGIGLIVKPDFWFLHDFQSSRNLVYFGGTVGVSIVLH